MAGIGSGTVFLLSALLVLMLNTQRGLADATSATLGDSPSLAFVIAAAGGLLVALLARPVVAEAPEFAPTEIPLRNTSRAVWFGDRKSVV